MTAAPLADAPNPTARRMAEAMREIASAEGGCTPDDLRDHGFNARTVARHGAEAQEIANHLATRRP